VHQSKKEMLAANWNQKGSFESTNQLENDYLLDNTLQSEPEYLTSAKKFLRKK